MFSPSNRKRALIIQDVSVGQKAVYTALLTLKTLKLIREKKAESSHSPENSL